MCLPLMCSSRASIWLRWTRSSVRLETGTDAAAFGTGFSMALRAVQKPHFDLVANAVMAPTRILTAVVFIKLWRIGGAALSLAAGSATMGAVFFLSFIRLHRRG